MPGSLPQKLQLRQIYGGEKLPGSTKPIKYYEKCPENFQIPLRRISDYDSFKNGHVYVGFSSDGKYLLSYQCKLCFQMDTEPVCYNYTLHWWLFDLWQPIKKVREVQLFAHESIHNELHILICQPPNAEYIVVHGCTYSVDTQSNGKMTHVSIIPTDIKNHSIHLRYELLPPHPPFVTSISLKLPNVILLNSGDMLFAIMLNRYITNDHNGSSCTEKDGDTEFLPNDCYCYCELMKARLKLHGSGNNVSDQFKENSELKLKPIDKEIICNDETYTLSQTVDASLSSYRETCSQELLSDNIFPKSKLSKSCKSPNVVLAAGKYSSPKISEGKTPTVSEEIVNDVIHSPDKSANKDGSGNLSQSTIDSSEVMRRDDCISEDQDGCNKEYVSYVLQGFSLPADEGSPESLPASPFDCTTQVLPCHLSSVDGSEELKHTYEHRCFRSADKGTKSECDYFIGQAQFDAENFVNEEIQMCDDIYRRYVSMRDYDMQIIDVCEETEEVIILINALVVFRDIVQRDDKLPPMNTQLNKNAVQRENCYKLILYTLGYIVSWNVYTGRVTVLRRLPIVEGPGTICKSRQFNPSLSQTVKLRQGFFVPSAKNASVQTLSNHTVFSGKSLQYLFNPLLPVAVVM